MWFINMSKIDINPNENGKDTYKNFSIEYETTEFNLTMPTPIYDLFLSLVKIDPNFDCKEINILFQKLLLFSLTNTLKETFGNVPFLLEKYTNIIKQFILDTC